MNESNNMKTRIICYLLIFFIENIEIKNMFEKDKNFIKSINKNFVIFEKLRFIDLFKETEALSVKIVPVLRR